MARIDLSFWAQQCPVRQPGLHHVHDADCVADHEPRHAPDQCCECGARATSWNPPTPVVRLIPPDMPRDTRDNVLVEPRYATGKLPDRPGWGRMPWTERDAKRLIFIVTLLGGHLGE